VLNEGPSKDWVEKRNTFLQTSRQIFIIIAYTYSHCISYYTFSLFNTNTQVLNAMSTTVFMIPGYRCFSILKIILISEKKYNILTGTNLTART